MLGLPRLGAELLFTYMHTLIHEHPLPQTGVAWLGKCSGSNIIDRFLQPLNISTQTTLLEPNVHAAYHHLAFVSWGNHPQRWDRVQHSASNGGECAEVSRAITGGLSRTWYGARHHHSLPYYYCTPSISKSLTCQCSSPLQKAACPVRSRRTTSFLG